MFIVSNFLLAAAKILDIGLTLYVWIVIGRALVSWLHPDPYNPIVRFLYSATEPVLRPVRRWIPVHLLGGIDLSPVAVLLGIYFVRIFLVQSLVQLALRIS